MRNFGSLGGRVSRGLRTQAVLRNYPSPVYLQKDTGFPYGTYGAPSAPPGGASVQYYSVAAQDTDKHDVAQSAVTGAFDVLGQIVQGQYALRGAQVGGDPYATTTSGSSVSSSSSSGLLIGLAVAAVAVGSLAFVALR